MVSCYLQSGRLLTSSSLSWSRNYLRARQGRVPYHTDACKMDPLLNDVVCTREEHSDTWVMVRETLQTKPQIEEFNTSSTQKPAIIIDNEALSDVACQPPHTNCYPPTIGVVLHTIKSSDANPTPDPKVESADSTATGLTFGAHEDVSSDPQPRTPAEGESPSQPLTRANLGPNTTPGMIRDIQAWINGDLEWLRVPVSTDQATDMPFARGTTCHSSDGSLDFVFVPARPSSFGRDAQAIGTWFEETAFTKIFGSDMEVWRFPGPSY
ncbi:hypothetical protein F5883DRAFT_260446 [Diaporthe sp. PMI_573]|nr:hypothetical protein F5883DRAFT_260446 [Diaporthaceae sp. PMI_573]